jgi:hypothetical protein
MNILERKSAKPVFTSVPENAMFHFVRNTTIYGTNDLIDRFMTALRELGPRTSLNEVTLLSQSPDDGKDATVRWRVAGESFTFALDVKVAAVSAYPSDEPTGRGNLSKEIPVVVAPFVTRAAQTQLESRGISYWDPTGNVLLQSRKPFVWVKTDGSSKNSIALSTSTALQSLKGRSASEVVVRLLANGRAATVRDLARESGTSLGTASRVVSLLRNENLLEPTGDGPIVVNDPMRLARRWSEDYSFEKTFKAQRYFSILGSTMALERVRASGANYALTGLAAQALWYEENAKVAPLPSSELWMYTDDVERLEKTADLVPDNANGTIMIAQTDFFGADREGYRAVKGIRTAWPWRIVGDLLSLSGRYSAAGADFAQELIARPMSPYA